MVSSESYLDSKRYPIVQGNQQGSYKLLEMAGGYVSIAQTPDSNEPPGSYFRKNSQYGKDSAIPSDSSFYFRLSMNNLYYTATDKDLVVLGAISISNVQTI